MSCKPVSRIDEILGRPLGGGMTTNLGTHPSAFKTVPFFVRKMCDRQER